MLLVVETRASVLLSRLGRRGKRFINALSFDNKGDTDDDNCY